ncbi:MAG: hypothetical protein ACREDO_04855 [Methyloceanibacter sp.]
MCNSIRCNHALQEEIAADQRGEVHLDLEVRHPVAIDVALDDAVLAAELPVDARERGSAELEGLIAGEVRPQLRDQ